MSTVRERLQQYREKEKTAGTIADETAHVQREVVEVKTSGLKHDSPGSSGIPLPEIDVLNVWMFRKWRDCYENNRLVTMVSTLIFYIFGQLLFLWYEFGLVFFIMSIFIALFLSLGTRSIEEVSAYSVFNENCERLLGQMTAEHFERDMLRRRK